MAKAGDKMKIREILIIESSVEERKIPSDIADVLETKRYSHSKNEYIEIGDMELKHFIRVFNQYTKNNIFKPVENMQNEQQ
jgi:hypothetical protein